MPLLMCARMQLNLRIGLLTERNWAMSKETLIRFLMVG